MRKPDAKQTRSKRWKALEFLFIAIVVVLVIVIARRLLFTALRGAEQKEATQAMAQLNAELSASQAPERTAEPSVQPTEAPAETPVPTEVPVVTEDPEPDATEFSQVAQAPEKPGKATPVPPPRNTPNPDMLSEAQQKLRQNSDYVGMVGFGDMAMYVCQADDNSYYATHRFDRAEDRGGMIYMDCRCESWPLGDNTVLYGHNMKDGTRFGQLQHFLDPNYLDQHPYVQFATLYGVRKYRPISIMRLSIQQDHEDFLEFDRIAFDSAQDFNVYVEGIKARSILRLDDIDVRYGAHLLTLATCSEAYDGGRLVVVCVEMDD